ncbi:MAG: restriction endonuclease subunit S, partial [Syntrophomonadaceae bacterium]|nr:restriction endonuclease subunit S [Syntrophomonadaceae bacterium]
MDKIKYRKEEEMKDSGIEWLGMIPQEWEVTSLRQSLEKPITDGPHETPKYVDVGVPFISVDSLSNSSKIVNLDIVNKFISEEKFNEYNKKTQLKKNDILFSKSATIGKVAIVDDRKFMTWSPLAIIKSDAKKIYYKLLYYILSSERYINHITSLSNLNTQLNIGMKVLEKSKLATSPDLTEQQKIANFLDIKTAQLESIISKKQLLIEKLEEAKKSLITEVVTGKVKIIEGQMVKRKPEEMKDSGIEWLGMIPQEWEVTS